ncbi:MAG: hypothetical protein EOM67_05785 [Spirochaetia bacterium]|nr:hypothetical protein [Spirochaetia bacterium]
MMKGHHIIVMTKVHTKETLLNPSYYIAIVISLILGYLPIRSFLKAIGPQGFMLGNSPLFTNITGAMERLFSTLFVQNLFSEGPFLFALYVAYIPILAYVLISSIVTYHQHSEQSVIELLRCGPFRSSSYIISLFIKDLITMGLFAIYLIFFFFAVSRFNNLLLGPMFVYSLVSLLIVTLLVCAYGKLAMVIPYSTLASLFLFIGIIALFSLLQLGTYSIVSESIQTISSLLSMVVRYLSPFYYITLIQTGFTLSSGFYLLGGIVGTLFLTAIIGLLALFIVRKKELAL